MGEEPVQFSLNMKFEKTERFAIDLDAQDRLKDFRKWFHFPKHNHTEAVYFLGNSLGLQPVSTRLALAKVMEQWADMGVESFFKGKDPWLDFHDQLTLKLSSIVGANPSEISIMNQLTVNIHLMLASFYKPSGRRKKILIESKAFPSDEYAIDSFLKMIGADPNEILIEINSSKGNEYIDDADIIDIISQQGDEIALVFLGGVNYYTGQVFDMQSICNAAHKVGALVGFDLAHAVGNIKLDLHRWDVDFACWCSYKYLNAGPGAVAAVFINEKFHSDQSINRLAGWWGNNAENRFLMKHEFEPASDATGWQLSTPSILLFACLKASLSIFEHAGWDNLLVKQELMKSYLRYLIEDIIDTNSSDSIKCLTPDSRGCQISLYFNENGKRIFESLTLKGFMIDWREPGVIRLAPVPLYNKFSEIWNFYEALKLILQEIKK
jgi:kynureninase